MSNVTNKLWNNLTDREREAALLVAQGFNREDGADEMDVAIKTFDHHRLRVLSKLELDTSIALVWFCLKHKILSLNAKVIR